ncbi:pirin family protein [Reichenbachiella sp.]|uniref:pirin family protein n=1 Tax=Reichenbachiella sp. TaxID=2184521 RepID=UPI003BAE859C
MSVEIISKHHQAQGAFDFGRIRENKPIGFPHEPGGANSMSNLFYWAHAWSDTGGLIDTHPHQGFEIMSYVIGGKISHYDTKYDRWLDLDTGDAQVIRAGNGISHAEKVLPGGEFFQIWFDPDLTKSLKKEASYSDIKAADFPTVKTDNGTVKTIVGEGSPMKIDTERVSIMEISDISGSWSMDLDKDSIYTVYVLNGEGQIADGSVVPNDFFVLKDESHLNIDFSTSAKLFIIQSPAEVSYRTYAEGQTF